MLLIACSKTPTRDEFKAMLIGKTSEEVSSLVGAPERTSENGKKRTWWYKNKTDDSYSGKRDKTTTVGFDDMGHVTAFSFSTDL